MPAITDAAITAAVKRAAASKSAIVLKDPGQTGLQLRIAPTGSRTWRLQCRDATGQPRRFTVGQHPALGLAQARIACRALREDVRKGLDPIADAQRKRSVERAGDTLASLIDLYEREVGGAKRSWPEYRRRIASVFAKQLAVPLPDLTLPGLQMTVDRWPSKQSAAAAVRYLRPVLKWAVHPGRGYVARDLVLISPPATKARRERVLDREELVKLLPVLRASTSAYAAALQFMLLTACRREEAGAACWRDVDLTAKRWRLPDIKNTKSDGTREAIVPLSRQAIALLRTRLPDQPDRTALVFTSDGARIKNWDRATKAFMTASGTADWQRHDLRRTAATLMGELGIAPHVIEAALNHTPPGAKHLPYNFALYLPDVAEALQKLADHLDVIPASGGNVVALLRRK